MKGISSIKCTFLFSICLLIIACSTRHTTEQNNEVAELDSGEVIARKYCGSCHLFPSPDLLDKKTWANHTLPSMGYRFGIYEDRPRDSLIEKGFGGRIVEQANIFPANQIISDREWELIKQFYHNKAPDELTVSKDSLVQKTSVFKSIVPDFKIIRPAVSALAYDEINRRLFVADCSREKYSSVTILDASFKPIASLGLPHPVSNLTLRSDTLYILMMGHFVPSDEPAGKLIKAIKNEKGNYEGYQQVVKDLKRPVDVAYADLDEDGDDDIVVCEFGNHTGNVSLFRKDAKNKYSREVLLNSPGAVKVLIDDMNNDTKKDIVVLMAQGDEGLDIYFNEGKGQFRRERVLQFPPVYGSASFCVEDMNNDGRKDIVYVNGDNADASQVLKPYHGIRVFLNHADDRFAELYFYSMPGAYKAIVHDFDRDGDMDVAAISFFPDFIHHPEYGFVYLENISGAARLNFVPSILQEAKGGRWITMERGDFDHDNGEDILLGSFTSMTISGDTLNTLRDYFQLQTKPLLLLKNSLLKNKTGI